MTATTTRAPSKPATVANRVRLDLTIGGTTYEVERLAETFQLGFPAFQLVKSDGTTYDVAQTHYGPQCDCPDYIFRRDGLDPSGCKHIRALLKFDLLCRHS